MGQPPHLFFYRRYADSGISFELLVVFLIHNKHQNTRDQVKGLAVILFVTLLATCLNPSGIWGAIYPFHTQQIWTPVIENYSVLGVLREGYVFLPLIYFGIVFGLVCLSWLYALTRNRSSFLPFGNFLLSVFFFAIAWSAIRNFALSAYFALPIAAVNLKNLLGDQGKASSSLSILKFYAEPGCHFTCINHH